MKRGACYFATIILVTIIAVTSDARQQKTKAQSTNQTEMMNATPGDTHKALAKLAGDYTTTTRFFMQPGAPPAESSGTAKISLALDGRFLTEEDSGTFMGQPTQGFKILGYNNASNRYEGIWTYTMSTAIMTLNGTSADGGRTVSFSGTYDEGSRKQTLQIAMRFKDDDHFEVELTSKQPDGKPGPKLVTAYVRKK